MPTADVYGRHGISSATFYSGKSRCGGRAVLSIPIAGACVNVPPGTMILDCAGSCACWPTSAGAWTSFTNRWLREDGSGCSTWSMTLVGSARA